MTKNRKLTNEEVTWLLDTEVYPTTKQEARNLKYRLLDDVQERLGEDWYLFRPGTQKAIEFMCFLSVDRGLFYARPETIATKYGIGKSTVYGALRVLQDAGLLVKVHRTSRKQNGLGSAIYLVTMHPYFEMYRGCLALPEKAGWKADGKAESTEIACGRKEEEASNAPTYSLSTSSTKPKHMVIQSTVKAQEEIGTEGDVPVSDKKTWVKYVPKAVNELFAGIYQTDLREMWRKVTQAVKSVKLGGTLGKDVILDLGIMVIRSLFKRDKQGQLTLDEKCAYVYRAMENSVWRELGERRKAAMEFDGSTGYYETMDGVYVEAGDVERDYSGGTSNPVLYNWLVQV